MSADVAGYSRLMGKDETGTLSALKSLRRDVFAPQVTAHKGRVVKLMGDGALVEFPSIVNAVDCAIAIQQALAGQPIKLRIGINSGDIIIEGSDIYGDGVNVAARIQEVAEPGSVALSAVAHDQVAGKVEAAFDDAGEHELKNIDKPVRVYRWIDAAADPMPVTAGAEGTLPLPDKPSIAVLPFTNMSGDAEQEFFADGMTEDIITLLSSVPDLFVIARNSTFAYKGQSPDVRKVAGDLGVRYVLEGSVRKAGKRIRVTAQFVDAGTGNHIWAEKYDRDLEDIFAVQDEVAQGIAGALQSRLLVAEADFLGRKPPEALDAWGNIVKAKVKLFAYRRGDIDEAEPFARQAVEIEPDYGEAHAVLGHILAWRSYNGWTDDWYQAAKDAVIHCDRALALSPTDAAVLTDIGFAYWHLGRFLKAVPFMERAITFNPNAAMTCAVCGQALATIGRIEEGIRYVEQAFRLSPKDPLEYMFNAFMASSRYFAGDYEASRKAAELALQSHPDLVYAMLFKVAACVRLKQMDQARAMLTRVEKLGASAAIDNMFRPRTEGTLWARYTDAIREAMDREAGA
jgi:adenylate cyclase